METLSNDVGECRITDPDVIRARTCDRNRLLCAERNLRHRGKFTLIQATRPAASPAVSHVEAPDRTIIGGRMATT